MSLGLASSRGLGNRLKSTSHLWSPTVHFYSSKISLTLILSLTTGDFTPSFWHCELLLICYSHIPQLVSSIISLWGSCMEMLHLSWSQQAHFSCTDLWHFLASWYACSEPKQIPGEPESRRGRFIGFQPDCTHVPRGSQNGSWPVKCPRCWAGPQVGPAAPAACWGGQRSRPCKVSALQPHPAQSW